MTVPASKLLRRGAMRRCPVCAEGHLFRRWVVMADSCPACGLNFRREPGQWLGSWFLNVCLVQTVVILILAVGVGVTWPDPPIVAIGILTVVSALVVPVLFFPFSRTIWVAIDLVMTPLGFNDGVAPGFELAADLERLRIERSSDGVGD